MYELDRQVEVIGKSSSGFDKLGLDLNPMRLEFQHRCQRRDHSESAAPFTERRSNRQVPFGDGVKRAINGKCIAWHK